MISHGAYFRASVRRSQALPPVWLGRSRHAQLIVDEIRLDEPPIDWPDAPLPIEAFDLIEAGGCAPAIVVPVVDPVPQGKDPAPVAPAKPDWSKVAARLAMQRKEPPAPKAAPTRVAMSAEPCGRCGVLGWRGCEHQLPYEAWTPANARADQAADRRKNNGNRKGGKGAIRI